MAKWTTNGRILACAALAVLLPLSCASAPQNSTKKKVSKSKPEPDQLFEDEDLSAGGAKGSAASSAKASKTPPVAKTGPKWSVPGAPQTDTRPAAVETPEVAESAQTPEGPAANGTKTADDRRWSICLLSFTGEDHEQLAKAACTQVRGRYPSLDRAFVRSKGNGSAVFVGRFTAPGDPAAKPLLKEVHAITDGATRPFARAMLTRWETASGGKPGPFDMRSIRAANPDKRTIYSMEVAVWSDFGSGELSVEEIRKKAEAYTARLRTQGFAAYYNHDDDRRMSIVTIGVFGEDAYNSQTMLYSDEVEAIRKRFPKLLVNGEELQRLVRTGSTETTPEKSFLVEVPK